MHHSENENPELSKVLGKVGANSFASQINERLNTMKENAEEKAGATGKFPEGKLTEKDQGEIKLLVGVHKGKVVIDFGEKPISWFAMNKRQALDLGKLLNEKAYLIPED